MERRESELDDEFFEIDDDELDVFDVESDDEFVQGSVDPDDIATGFSTTIPSREIDVDEDTQGDEILDTGVDEPLTQFEVSTNTHRFVHGDEIELDLDEVLATGRTVARAPEED